MRIRARKQPRSLVLSTFEWKDVLFEHKWPEYHPLYWALEWRFLESAGLYKKIETSECEGYQTDHFATGNITYCFWIDENGRLEGDNCTSRMLSDGISLHYHQKFVEKAIVWRYCTPLGT